MLILLYLLVIVAANLSVAAFGPTISILNAFLFIGLDLTTRDTLHERWLTNLWRNMALLIATGSLLSALLNWQALPIAIASCVAFAVSAIADTLVYSALHNRAKLVKINGSNVVSAGVDSILFPALAFGFPLLISIMIGQFIAKVGGGFLWSIILNWPKPALLSPTSNRGLSGQ